MPDDPTTPQGQAPNGETPQAGTPVPSQADANANTPTTSPDDLLRQIKELRAENASHRAKSKEREQAAQAELDKQLAEQGKYKELAEKHETRVRELEMVASDYTDLAELVAERIKTETKEWPAEVKSLFHGKDTPIKLRLEQVEKLRPLVERLTTQAQGQQPGNRPNPRPSQNMTPDEVSEKALSDLRQRSPGKYQL